MFSKRTEYALRALVHFAKQGEASFLQSRDLSKQERLPTKFLESVLLGLKRHGYLESKVGSGGGYRLTRPASKITIGELIRKLEGLDTATTSSGSDAVAGETALRLIEERLANAHADALDSLTLEQLVDEVAKRATNRDEMYYI